MVDDPKKTYILKPDQKPQLGSGNKEKKACLIILAGNPLGKVIFLNDKEVKIGRDEKNDIAINDTGVSRFHATVTQKDNNWVIKDNNSTNGTYLNFYQVNNGLMQNGNIISIGQTVFKFIFEDDLESAYHREIYDLTIKDGLTELPNKQFFIDFLTKEIARIKRQKFCLSIFMMDIDHFKKVNDTYGHPAGDFVLKELAQTVNQSIREEDLFARYGGEEFIGLLTNSNLKHSKKILEKIRKTIEKLSLKWNEVTLSLTVSIGITQFEENDTSESIIKRADELLYKAKESGRNKIITN